MTVKLPLILATLLAAQALAGDLSLAPPVDTLRAQFRETKRMKLLLEPVVSRGRVLFRKPDRLLWSVLEPNRFTLLIEGTRMRMIYPDLGHREEMDASVNPVAKAVVSTFLAVAGGRLDELQALYKVTMTAREGGGRLLRLTPGSPDMARAISFIEVELDQASRVSRVRTQERDGDVSEIEFLSAEYNVPLSPKEWGEISAQH